MPLFGGKQPSAPTPAESPLQPELDRLSGLTLPQLASEVMTRGWGPGGPGAGGETSVARIGAAFVPGYQRADSGTLHQFTEVLGEGVQVLEHAGLVRFTFWGGADGPIHAVTRLGQAALDQNAVDRILAGGSL